VQLSLSCCCRTFSRCICSHHQTVNFKLYENQLEKAQAGAYIVAEHSQHDVRAVGWNLNAVLRRSAPVADVRSHSTRLAWPFTQCMPVVRKTLQRQSRNAEQFGCGTTYIAVRRTCCNCHPWMIAGLHRHSCNAAQRCCGTTHAAVHSTCCSCHPHLNDRGLTQQPRVCCNWRCGP
jgi:hypothetical protein